MRLNQAAVDRAPYVGKSSLDQNGREQWPSCTVWDEEIPGFGMRIHPPGAGGVSRKEFVYSYSTGARSRVMLLGTYGASFTLKQARRVAADALAASRRGLDPIEARQSASGVGTVEDLAKRFLALHTMSSARKSVPSAR